MLFAIAILFVVNFSSTENFAFKQGHKIDKEACKRYFLSHYWECLANSDFHDANGDCLNRLAPRLRECDF